LAFNRHLRNNGGSSSPVANPHGLSQQGCLDTITLATSFSSGLWGFIHDGSQAKKIHAGRAAEGGLLATTLAGEGFAGPSKVFEDLWGGFFRSFNKSSGEPEKLSEALAENWKINRAVLKPYASCRGAHSAIDALEDILQETQQKPENIVSMHLQLSEMLMGMCGHKTSKSMAGTQMSLPYALAARCVFGTAGLVAYSSQCRSDPRIGANHAADEPRNRRGHAAAGRADPDSFVCRRNSRPAHGAARDRILRTTDAAGSNRQQIPASCPARPSMTIRCPIS
jgi:2-methylcitrate dehydratase PrpD